MTSSFIADLSLPDLERLRAIVRRVYFPVYPMHLRTDAEADKIIEALGPAAREAMVKAAIDNGRL